MAAPDLAAQRARLRERLIIDGTKLDADIMGRVTGAKLTRAYDSATALALTCDDHDFVLLRSGLLTRRGKSRKDSLDKAAWARFGQMRLTLDGAFFRLAGVSGDYTTGRSMTLTFEDEVASLMRRHTKAKIQGSRATSTRAEFIGTLAEEVKEIPISYHSPEQNVRQHIKGDDARTKRKDRERGLGGGVTVKGFKARKDQRKQIETALGVADEVHANELATVAMLCAGIGESSFRAVPNSQGSNYHGVFQGSKDTFAIGDTAGMARSFLLGGKGFQQGGAIELARENPDMEPGEIATRVEASGQPAGFYGVWAKEAHDILDSYGGVGRVQVKRRRFVFRREDGETSWACSDRLAQEVRWRRWADENMLWFASDEWLIQRAPTFTVSGPDDPEIRGMTFDADVGTPVSEVIITASVARWVGGPGSVVELSECGPYDGRWLLAVHELDLLMEDSTLTYRRPQPKLPEPAADRSTVLLTESGPVSGSPRQRILKVARKAFALAQYYSYDQIRPMHKSLFVTRPAPRTGAPIPVRLIIDCSEFVTLVYKAAGVPDPNGLSYNGTGNTSTLRANGTKTSDPQPGDLVHFGTGAAGNASHVGVYMGNGEMIDMAGSGMHRRKVTSVGIPVAGYWTYELEG